jgi:hypothetical protein
VVGRPVRALPVAWRPGDAGGQRADRRARQGVGMPSIQDRHVLVLPEGMCRRCVRALSRRLRDLPGVVWFEIDVAAGVARISGEMDVAAAQATVNRVSCSQPGPDEPGTRRRPPPRGGPPRLRHP